MCKKCASLLAPLCIIQAELFLHNPLGGIKVCEHIAHMAGLSTLVLTELVSAIGVRDR